MRRVTSTSWVIITILDLGSGIPLVACAEAVHPQNEVHPAPHSGGIPRGEEAGRLAPHVSHVKVVRSEVGFEDIHDARLPGSQPLLLRGLEADLVAPPYDLLG